MRVTAARWRRCSPRSAPDRILFEIGGIVPVVFALAAIVTLPESIKFMTLHESHRGKMEALLTSIRPRSDPVRDWRHRAGGVRARRHRDAAGIDQIHDPA